MAVWVRRIRLRAFTRKIQSFPAEAFQGDSLNPTLSIRNRHVAFSWKFPSQENLLTDTSKRKKLQNCSTQPHTVSSQVESIVEQREGEKISNTKHLGRKLSTRGSTNSKVISFHIYYFFKAPKHFGIAISWCCWLLACAIDSNSLSHSLARFGRFITLKMRRM